MTKHVIPVSLRNLFSRISFHIGKAFTFTRVTFSFKADVDGVLLTLTAERIYRSKQSERYRLSIAGTGYTLVVQTNRPAAEGKKDRKAVQWHIVEGVAFDKSRLENVYKQLEISIHKHPSLIQGTLNFINHF